MRVIVKLYATLRKYVPSLAVGAGVTLDLPEGSDVAALAARLGIPDGVPLVAVVDDEVVHLDHVLLTGDAISLFPPVAGG